MHYFYVPIVDGDPEATAVERNYQRSELYRVVNVPRQDDLEAVKTACEKDPTSCNDFAINDAFRQGASVEVLLFLTNKAKEQPRYGVHYPICPMIPIEFREAGISFPMLDNEQQVQTLKRLKDWFDSFPQAKFCNTEYPKCSPFNVVLFSTVLPPELLDYMVETHPEGTGYLDLSDTEHDRTTFPVENYTRILDERRMAAVDAMMGKVHGFDSGDHERSGQEWARLLSNLVRGDSGPREVVLQIGDFESTVPYEEWIAPVKQQLKDRGSAITEFCFQPTSDDVSLNLSIFSLFPHMKCLKRLFLEDLSDVNAIRSVCELVEVGYLEDLVVNAPYDEKLLLLPLLDAINKSAVFSNLRIRGCHDTEAEAYQEKLLEMLQSNTRLELALVTKLPFDKKDQTDFNAMHDCREFMTDYNNCWDFLGDDGNDLLQKKLTYWTLLNICGRTAATETSLEGFVDVVSMEEIADKVAFLKYSWDTEEEELLADEYGQLIVTNMQFGLLREAPSLWSLPKEQSTGGRSGKRTNLAMESTSTKKSKHE
ncbi:expressed unknown protein [Seminavis robusta]|uniref:Uncharacterized protein n=1 Tax=Seminavis robusta TaxID=568900 RepID=A0A9N8D8W7_9STRA|nr:expressed unknown protein [Seminavis robusta]|eukprot:Sro39_g024310.1 n/a (538) ;mRNA; r:135715-137328